jgi:glutathione peroxidase
MSKSAFVLALIISGSIVMAQEKPKVPPALNFKMKSLTGKEVDLAKYQGKVLLIVNVASACGYTPQYRPMQALHEKYSGQGLAVIGVPCNQFGAQEPGSEKEIEAFCDKNYGVKFDMLSKVDVNGPNACGLYQYLTKVDAKPEGAGKISWNFEKFVIGRNGEVVARFSPGTEPNDPEVLKVIEAELANAR